MKLFYSYSEVKVECLMIVVIQNKITVQCNYYTFSSTGLLILKFDWI